MIAKIDNIVTIQKGKKPKIVVKNSQNRYMPYVDIKAFERGIIDNYTDGEKCLSCDDGDLLIVCDGARSGLVGKAIKGYVGSTLARIDVKESLNPNYLYYFIQGKYTQLNTNMKGSGTPHLNQQLLKSFEIYLPSLEEQERIVSRIEELFSQLDSGVETLKKTKEQLAVYRQAVLKEAFLKAGEKHITLGEIIEKPKYGTSKKCDYSCNEDSVSVYRIPNIDYKSSIINHNDLKYATFTSSELTNIDLRENDLLIIRSNGSISLVGRSAIVRSSDTDSTFAGYLMRIRFIESSEIKAKYLYYYLESYEARIYIENVAKSTSGVHNINSNEVKNIKLPMCDEKIMEGIISEIESRLSVCDSIEQTIDAALQEAEALRQSILKQAFEGKLNF